jgi:O-antigen/teichoic acid export membrane protein
MAEDSLKEKAARGLMWGGISNVLRQMILLLTGIILMKSLSPGDYGIVGMLAIFTDIANIVRESGFPSALINKKEVKHEDYNSVFWFNIISGSVIYIILFMCAPLIASFFREPELIQLSRVIFLAILISSFGGAHYTILSKNLMVKKQSLVDIISLSVAAVVAVILAFSGKGAWSLVLNPLTYSIVSTSLLWKFSNWRPTFGFDFQPLKEMFRFSARLMLSNIVTSIHTNFFSILIGKFNSRNDVGYFSQGTKWASLGALLIQRMMAGIAQPVFSKVGNELERQEQVFRKMLRFIAFVSFPMLLGFAFISGEFIALVNRDFLPCVPILQMYCLWGAFSPILLLYTTFAVSRGRSAFLFRATLAFAAVQIGMSFLALRYGINCVAFSNVAISFLYLLVWHVFVRTLIPISFIRVIKDISPYLIISLAVFGFAWAVTLKIRNLYLLLALKVTISTVMYILIMKWTNSVIFRETIDFFSRKISGFTVKRI